MSSTWFASPFGELSTSKIDDKKNGAQPRGRATNNLAIKSYPNQGYFLCSVNWIENFTPETVEDLAVHTKKVQEVQYWIRKAITNKRNGSVLVITGPTGSGKTATVRVICKTMGLQLNEWITPMDTELYHEFKYNESEGYCSIEKQSDKFMEFLLKASRYNSLFDPGSCGRLVLVEDFPNYLLRDTSAIHNVLEKYKEWGISPLVFICTDVKGKEINIANNLFTDSVRETFHVETISFNAISTTGLKSALKRAATLMSKKHTNFYKPQNSDVIDAIINTSMGDVRSALTNLHFASLKDSKCGDTLLVNDASQLSTNTKKPARRGSRKSMDKLKTMGRDESLGLLHGVGRVLNPKRVDTPHGFRFTHSVAEIVDSFLSQPSSFIHFLHQNYPIHFKDIEGCVQATDNLSHAEQLSGEWEEREIASEYALYIAIGGLMVSNKDPAKQWCPVKGPKRLQVKVPTCQEMSLGLEHSVHKYSLATDFKTYTDIIKQQSRVTPKEDGLDVEINIEESD